MSSDPDHKALAALLTQARTIADALSAHASKAPPITWISLWTKHARAKRHLPSWPGVEGIMRPWLNRFGDRDVWSVTRADWRDYQDEDRSHTSNGTKNAEARAVAACIRWGRDEGLLPPDRVHPWERLPRHRKRQERRTEVDDDGLKAVLERDNLRFRVLLFLYVDCGLRRKEALAVEHSWIDWKARTLRLPGQMTKNRDSDTVPLTERTMDAIRALPRDLHQRYVLESPRKPGHPMTPQWATLTWRRYADKAGIEAAPGDGKARLHDLRGTGVAKLRRAGAAFGDIMKWGRWKDPSTVQHYIHRFSEDDRERLRGFMEEASKGQRRGPRPSNASPTKADRKKSPSDP